uniref:diacylglycerol/lipid kinase family protein n=1 Tax=uncultured Allobacillus sp. TaxID=1638025 RepID=UPI0025998485|nr:diacylglycerol kinase family protein [uncultured Allobacillus sp.]
MHVFIINPTAGKGKGQKIVEEFLTEHPQLKDRCKTFHTKYEGHATSLAEQIVAMHQERMKQLVVVGGDGTFYEVLNGLKDYPTIPLAFVPVGSGNDFARGLKTSLNPKRQLNALFAGMKGKPYWFGTYRTDLLAKNRLKLFASTIGFGFDAEITERVNASRYKRFLNKLHLSFLIYIIGILATLISFQPKTFEAKIDGKSHRFENVWLITLSNHPYFGGGMKIAPKAKNNQQHFSITVVHNISKIKLLFLFLSIFVGKHTRFKEVEELTGSRIEINSSKELSYQADGVTGRCYRCLIEKEDRSRLIKRK